MRDAENTHPLRQEPRRNFIATEMIEGNSIQTQLFSK